jgi:hypothetical protein
MEEHTKTCTKCAQTKPLTAFNKHPHGSDGRQARCRECISAAKRASYAAHRDERVKKQQEKRAAGEWGIMRRPPRTEPATDDKTCSKCAETKPHTEFNRNSAEVDGLQRICRECERVRHRSYYLENRHEILAAMREVNVANPEKNRAKARNWQKANWPRAKARQDEWRAANGDLVRQWARDWARRHPERRLHNTRKQRARRKTAPALPFTVEQLEARLSMFPGCWMCGGPVEAVDHMKPIAKGGWHALMNLRGICARDNSSKRDRWWGPADTIRRLRAVPMPALAT